MINQFFWPDMAPTGQLLLDVTRAVEGEQNKTTAICGAPDYGATDHNAAPPVRILRSRLVALLPPRARPHPVLCIVSRRRRLERLPHRPPGCHRDADHAPLTSVLGRLLKLSRGCRHFIWEMDVYPDIAVDLGVLRANSMLTASSAPSPTGRAAMRRHHRPG